MGIMWFELENTMLAPVFPEEREVLAIESLYLVHDLIPLVKFFYNHDEIQLSYLRNKPPQYVRNLGFDETLLKPLRISTYNLIHPINLQMMAKLVHRQFLKPSHRQLGKLLLDQAYWESN
jgi:hypothetical protein